VDRAGQASSWNFRTYTRITSNNQQNLTYGYDAAGNVTTITDSLFTASRTFGYDDLNRMASASGTFGPLVSNLPTAQSCLYAYNAIGNLTDKCGAAFSYGDAMHPSAVTLNPATGRSYSYDANGNMTARGTQ
jgi:YD repeat-containing protein